MQTTVLVCSLPAKTLMLVEEKSRDSRKVIMAIKMKHQTSVARFSSLEGLRILRGLNRRRGCCLSVGSRNIELWSEGSTHLGLPLFISPLIFASIVRTWSSTPIAPPCSWSGLKDNLSPQGFPSVFEPIEYMLLPKAYHLVYTERQYNERHRHSN